LEIVSLGIIERTKKVAVWKDVLVSVENLNIVHIDLDASFLALLLLAGKSRSVFGSDTT
jgi:hypothetical protein